MGYIREQNRFKKKKGPVGVEYKGNIRLKTFKYSIASLDKHFLPFRAVLVNFQMTTDIWENSQ